MRFRRQAPLVLLLGSGIVVGLLTLNSVRRFDAMLASTEQSQFELMRSIWNFNLKCAESRALARAEMVAALPNVRRLFAAQDREGLLAELQEMFQIQKEKYGVDQAQFHVLPAVSFLRLHSPD